MLSQITWRYYVSKFIILAFSLLVYKISRRLGLYKFFNFLFSIDTSKFDIFIIANAMGSRGYQSGWLPLIKYKNIKSEDIEIVELI